MSHTTHQEIMFSRVFDRMIKKSYSIKLIKNFLSLRLDWIKNILKHTKKINIHMHITYYKLCEGKELEFLPFDFMMSNLVFRSKVRRITIYHLIQVIYIDPVENRYA